jgi:hypothetical protein
LPRLTDSADAQASAAMGILNPSRRLDHFNDNSRRTLPS